MQGTNRRIYLRAFVAALAMAVVLIALSGFLVLLALDLSARGKVAYAAGQITQMAQSWVATREQLRTLPLNRCDQTTIDQLRQAALLNPYVIEIVLLDQQQAFCSSVTGPIEPSFELAPPDYNDVVNGTNITANAPLPALPSFTTWMTNLDRFAAFLDLRTAVSVSDHAELYYVDSAGEYLAYAGGKQGIVATHGTQGIGVSTQCLPIDYCLTAKADVNSAIKGHWWLFAVYLSTVLVIVWLFYLSALRWWRAYYSPGARVLRAIGKDGVLYNVYQPIVNLQTGSVVGCEVLSRFEDEFGRLRPDQFIAQIPKQKTWRFTEHVFQRAFDELSHCGCRSVSVNVFPHDLENLTQLKQSKVLHNAKLCEFKVCFEVLETEISDMAALSASAAWLREQGFGISIDDFGTGYSNLQSLNSMAFDFLKVDRSFTTEIESAAIKSSLWPNLVALAEALKVQIIAEGVENQSQARILNHLGVQYCQGYYFAAPMRVEQFKEFLLDPNLCQES